MNQIFQVSEQAIHIDSLIFELTSFCKKKCKGCYLKQHALQSKEIDWVEWVGLFNTFLLAEIKNYSCNQISISINERVDKAPFEALSSILYHNYFTHSEERKNTKIHLTMHSPSTILQYQSLLETRCDPVFDPLHLFSAADSIYFSNINSDADMNIISELRTLNSGLEIGWNCLSPNTINIDALKLIDDVYILVNKSRTGFVPSSSVSRKKTTIDRCWIDYSNWRKDWHNTTCAANISKFTIWPDGSVSGCPYTKRSNTGPAGKTDDILKNIVIANKSYDFNKCPLKELYKENK
jgi:hypothetical protein